jgi:hypothetical protein
VKNGHVAGAIGLALGVWSGRRLRRQGSRSDFGDVRPDSARPVYRKRLDLAGAPALAASLLGLRPFHEWPVQGTAIQ